MVCVNFAERHGIVVAIVIVPEEALDFILIVLQFLKVSTGVSANERFSLLSLGLCEFIFQGCDGLIVLMILLFLYV